MTIHYDEKGKFFTDVVSKDSVPVIIQTLTHKINGNVFKLPDGRIIDILNEASDQFLAVTQATLAPNVGGEEAKFNFISVNRANIIWLAPQDENGE